MNRVGNRYRDQMRDTGHAMRLDDLDRVAALGVQALRFPVLWERVSPEAAARCDWEWSDVRLAHLRALGVRPIVGLLHHGSGPRRTSLLDPDFALKFGDYAARVAERYPWVRDWTPVNEPLTTARFSALYGHWYPHGRDEGAFWRALVHQVEGIAAAMKAIRAVRPDARLIQTDDLGTSHATAAVRDQAAFDNARRWMAWDLLFGRVVPGHALWEHLAGFGLAQRLEQLAAAPCPPDVIGLNHYLTSDRFLDHRIRRYPAELRGGNGRMRYADTEAVRALDPPPPGLAHAIARTWERYATPIAITEVHNGCTREEQMRWMRDAWEDAQAARAGGVTVEAVTAWALFGNVGWDTLLTAPGGYECGVFDVRAGTPRATAMVPLLQALAAGRTPDHPALAGQGWWRRAHRLVHAAVPRPAPMAEHRRMDVPAQPTRPILIAGATGTLGQALARACAARDLAYVLTDRARLDLGDPASIDAALDRFEPWAVINATGWVRVDEAEAAEAACHAVNATGAERLAAACAARDIPTLGFSSDLVFDGTAARAYRESDPASPRNAYGRSKAAAEAAIGALPGRHLIIRTAAFFSPHDAHNFAVHALEALARGDAFAAAEDQVVSPSYVPHLCNAALDALIDGMTGLLHLTNHTAIRWDDFARALAEACGLNADLVKSAPGRSLGWRAVRPFHVPLASEHGRLMPGLEAAIEEFAAAPETAARIARIRAEARQLNRAGAPVPC